MKNRLIIMVAVATIIVIGVVLTLVLKPDNNSSDIQREKISKSANTSVQTSGLSIVYFTRKLSLAEASGLFRDAEIPPEAFTIHPDNFGATVEVSKAGVKNNTSLGKILTNNSLVSEVVDVVVPAK